MAQLDIDEVTDRFRHHGLSEEQIARVADLRARFTELAQEVVRGTRPSREQSLAITHLEDAAMWAIKGIARGG
jgi:hypothetical protein